MTRNAESATVGVDMVRCVGHGICTHVLGDLITLDPWGFPIVDSDPVTDPKTLRRARRAVRACPRRALLVKVVTASDAPGESRDAEPAAR